MKKIDLIRKLLDFADDMDDEVRVRVLTRDEHGVVRTEQTVTIDSIGNFLAGPTINVTRSNFTEERTV